MTTPNNCNKKPPTPFFVKHKRTNWVKDYPKLYMSLFMFIKNNNKPKVSVTEILDNAIQLGYTFVNASLYKQGHELNNHSILELYLSSIKQEPSPWHRHYRDMVPADVTLCTELPIK